MSDSYTNANTRSDTLNDAAAHDTGIYDPNIHDNQIVALYETDDRAKAARDALVAIGVPGSAVRLTDREQDRFVGGVDYERNDGGLWGALKSLFIPDQEAHGYAEGVRRGHAVLVVQPDATMDRHRVIQVLESTGPVDFDAKLEEWRQAGYSYPAAGESVHGASLGTGVPADTSAMRATDTTAAGTFRNAPSSSEGDYMSGARSGDLPGGAYEARSTGTTSTAEAARTMPPAAATPSINPNASSTGFLGQDDTIKVVDERLRVGKREVVKGAVRVRSYVVERPVEQNV
jgi:hypothetical protein